VALNLRFSYSLFAPRSASLLFLFAPRFSPDKCNPNHTFCDLLENRLRELRRVGENLQSCPGESCPPQNTQEALQAGPGRPFLLFSSAVAHRFKIRHNETVWGATSSRPATPGPTSLQDIKPPPHSPSGRQRSTDSARPTDNPGARGQRYQSPKPDRGHPMGAAKIPAKTGLRRPFVHLKPGFARAALR